MEILAALLYDPPRFPVRDICIGAFNTAVLSQRLGLATTCRGGEFPHAGVENGGDLLRMDSRELAHFLLSGNELECSLGMAAFNSMIDTELLTMKTLNAKDLLLRKGKNKSVGVIGHFPFIDGMKDRFRECRVFELNPKTGDYSAEEIPAYLPDAEVVAVTGMTFLNHSFEDVMEHISPDAYVILLGPSVPLTPLLFEFGVDAVCGTLIEDAHPALLQVKQGVPYRKMKGLQYVTLLKDRL